METGCPSAESKALQPSDLPSYLDGEHLVPYRQIVHLPIKNLWARRCFYLPPGVEFHENCFHVQRTKSYQATHHLPSGGAFMFSAWDFHSWIANVGAVLFMGILVIGFSAFVGTLMSRIFGEERDAAETSSKSRSAKEPSFREAA